jgi:hypothetical protein
MKTAGHSKSKEKVAVLVPVNSFSNLKLLVHTIDISYEDGGVSEGVGVPLTEAAFSVESAVAAISAASSGESKSEPSASEEPFSKARGELVFAVAVGWQVAAEAECKSPVAAPPGTPNPYKWPSYLLKAQDEIMNIEWPLCFWYGYRRYAFGYKIRSV